MATKAQEFKAEQQRAAHAPKKKAPEPAAVETKKRGVSANRERTGLQGTALRNLANRSDNKGGAALETSTTARPSRKSTRKSQGRIKQASNLTRQAVRETHAPSARATRR